VSFLHPLFFLGVLGLAAPIWLHLRRRQRRNVRTFSAVRFLDEEPFPREMPRRLRDLPLFLLRALALLLLIGAFAWPMLGDSGDAAQSETRIYLLDNTLSHRADGAFERARDEIAGEIRRAGRHVQVGVIEIAARNRVVADLSASHEESAAAVEALRPTHQRGNYLDAFRLAAAMLDRSLGGRRRLLVYGDRQRNQWEENVNVPPFLRDVEVAFPEAPGRNGAGNLSAGNTRSTRFPQREGSGVNLLVDVGAQPVNRAAHLSVKSNGAEVFGSDLAMDGGGATIRADWKTDDAGWLRGEVRVAGRPDALPEDDFAPFVVPPLEPGKIGLLARSPYLRASLDADISRGFWDVSVLDADTIRAEATADRPRFDALVVESDYLQSREARDLVLNHLNNGRGVVLFVTRRTPIVEAFLRTIGFRPGEARTMPDAEQRFRYAVLDHPLLQPFARPDFGDLLAIRLKKYLQLDGGAATGLLYSGAGDPVLFETRGTKGRMLVFGFGADAESSNWPLRPDFLPFMDLCLRYVRAASEQQVAVEPGGIYFRKFEHAAGATFVLVRNGAEAARAEADAEGRLRLIAPDEPGIYELRRDGALVGLVSVSASPKESDLQFIEETPAAVAAWTLPPTDPSPPAADGAPVRVRGWEDARSWWWLLAGAALLLLGEMGWVAGRRSLA
jgi:hypothetical protein